MAGAISPASPDPKKPAGMNLYERSVRVGHRAYKLTLSPWIGRQCRFLPTCSDYAAEALILHGPVRGGYLSVRRLCRCHPWGGSGYDPVPPRSAQSRKCET
jgi:putative membrane protein insertion efficiency factor